MSNFWGAVQFFRRPELFLLSQVVGVEGLEVFLSGKNT